MDIAISGASGLIGTALTASLRADGHRPIALVRRTPAAGSDEIRWDPAGGTIDAASLEGIDTFVHLAGAGIADKRWSDKRKAEIFDSRVNGTAVVATALAAMATKPTAFVCASAIGYYGSRGDEELTETTTLGTGFLAEVTEAWEAAAAPAAEAGIRTVFARTSIVLSDKGGPLHKQLPLFKLGAGGRFGPGTQWISWISLRDQVRALRFLIDTELSGPVNLCTPNPVTNLEFTKTLGEVLKRPTILPVPLIGPKLLFGAELVQELMLASQRCLPVVLADAGFTFEDPTLEDALRHVLDK